MWATIYSTQGISSISSDPTHLVSVCGWKIGKCETIDVFVSVHLFTVANADYFPQTRKEKGSRDYVGSDGLEGQTKTHLETIRDTKHTKRGKLQEGVRGRVKNRHPWGSSPAADCWSVFVMASHTYKHTNSPWQASPCHSLPNHARLISCQSWRS